MPDYPAPLRLIRGSRFRERHGAVASSFLSPAKNHVLFFTAFKGMPKVRPQHASVIPFPKKNVPLGMHPKKLDDTGPSPKESFSLIVLQEKRTELKRAEKAKGHNPIQRDYSFHPAVDLVERRSDAPRQKAGTLFLDRGRWLK